MRKESVALFMSLCGGKLDEVIVFRDPERGRAYYAERVREVFGSEREYRNALSNGSPFHRFHVFEALVE